MSTKQKAKRSSPRKFYGVPADKIPLATPQKMLDAIEAASVGGLRSTDPYRGRIETLLADAMTYADLEDREDATHLRETRAGAALEEMSRAVGFVLGCEFSEWLQARGGKTKGGAR